MSQLEFRWSHNPVFLFSCFLFLFILSLFPSFFPSFSFLSRLKRRGTLKAGNIMICSFWMSVHLGCSVSFLNYLLLNCLWESSIQNKSFLYKQFYWCVVKNYPGRRRSFSLPFFFFFSLSMELKFLLITSGGSFKQGGPF